MNLDEYEKYLQIKRSVEDKLIACRNSALSDEAKSELMLIHGRIQGVIDSAIKTQTDHLISINLLLLAEINSGS